MDCCGMPMAVRPGGGLMCRRCGCAVDVPVVVRGNRCSASCGVSERVVVEVVNRAPLVVPPPPGFEAEPVLTAEEAAEAVGGFQGPEMFAGAPEAAPVSFPDHVEQPKVSGIGRRGRRGGAK